MEEAREWGGGGRSMGVQPSLSSPVVVVGGGSVRCFLGGGDGGEGEEGARVVLARGWVAPVESAGSVSSSSVASGCSGDGDGGKVLLKEGEERDVLVYSWLLASKGREGGQGGVGAGSR